MDCPLQCPEGTPSCLHLGFSLGGLVSDMNLQDSQVIWHRVLHVTVVSLLLAPTGHAPGAAVMSDDHDGFCQVPCGSVGYHKASSEADRIKVGPEDGAFWRVPTQIKS